MALMLIAIGLLGISGSTALALRTTLDTAHRREAVHRATSRFSRLMAGGCARANSGAEADPTRQVTERWRVSAQANGFATITDSVSWMSARGPRSFSLSSAMAC